MSKKRIIGYKVDEDMEYLPRIPKTTGIVHRIPAAIPDGWVIVHNHLLLSSLDFRAWLRRVGTGPALEVCPCAWAPELATHYRVQRSSPRSVS